MAQLSNSVFNNMSIALRERMLLENSRSTARTPLALGIRECARTLSRVLQRSSDALSLQDCLVAACQAAAKWLRYGDISSHLLPRKLGSAHDSIEIAVSVPMSISILTLAAFTNHLGLPTSITLQADVNVGSRFFGTPLIAAASNGSLGAMRTILSMSATVDFEYEVSVLRGTALVAAARYGQMDAVKVLLENGASSMPTVKQFQDHCVALSAAARGGYEDIVNLLAERDGCGSE